MQIYAVLHLAQPLLVMVMTTKETISIAIVTHTGTQPVLQSIAMVMVSVSHLIGLALLTVMVTPVLPTVTKV